MLPEKLFINLIDTDLQNQIANCKTFDKDATNALTTLLEQGLTAVQNVLNDWTMEEFEGKTVLFYKGKNYIPQDDNIRRDIARMFHDNETAGHPGELETYNSIRHHYWWPGMCTYIKNYVKGCGTCQQFKIDREPSLFQQKAPPPQDHSPIVQWTSSQIFHWLTTLIPSWSW